MEVKPRGKPFQKGQSGNPLGRIPGKRTHDTLISEATARGLEGMVADGTVTAAEALAHRRIEIGLRAKPGIALAAIDSIENRVEGRATQSVRITQTMDEDTARTLARVAQLLSPRMPKVLEAEIVETSGQEPEGQ
jgi:hypothetical protein